MARVAREPRRSRAATGLSHESIRQAALRAIDEDGLEALSMRRLGAALGCEGMALYWYYPSKDALLDAVVELLMAGVAATLEAGPAGWVDAMREVARAYRRVGHDHPRAFPLLATRRFASDGTYRFLERLFELARGQGIDDRTIARHYRVISAYCSGFVLNELAAPRGPQDPGTAALRRRFPRVDAVSTHLEARHLDEVFEFGLGLQLDALARATVQAVGARGRAR